MSIRAICFSTLFAAVAFCTCSVHERPLLAEGLQSQQQSPPSKGYSSSETKQAEAQSPDQHPNQAVDPHKYDRYNAEKDIDVADFYMHKGDPDAAIPRLQEAARLQPNYGKPRLMLAECYEKKHDPDNAVKYLKEYLKVYPHAPDTKKVEKKIAELEKQ